MKNKLMKKLVSFAAFAFFALCLSPVLSAQAASGEALKEKYAETIPENIALAKVKTKLNIRSGPGKSYQVIGYMLPDAACYIESIDSNGWAKVKSGEISGYTLTTYLYMEEEAQERAVSTGSLVAVVNADATVSKVTYRLTKLVEAGVAEKTQTTIPATENSKARKVQAYRAVALAE